MKIYGWDELNEACWGIQIRIVDREDISVDPETGEVSLNDFSDANPMWFTTFRKAKATAIEWLNEGVRWRKQAITEITKIRKASLE